jgi:hypothetical protein
VVTFLFELLGPTASSRIRPSGTQVADKERHPKEAPVNRTSFKLLASLALLAAIPATGFAQSVTEDTGSGPSHRFGNKSQLAISSDAALEIRHTSPGDTTSITLQPAVDYFIIDNLSLGGFIGFTYQTAENASTTIFAIGPRVGYNITLSDLVSIWPKVGFSFQTSNTEVDDDDSDISVTTNDNSALALNLFVPIVFHPATHFFAGFGPFLDTDLSGDDKLTSFGLKLSLGGWLEM